jgi:hypothetical protein
VKIEYYGDRRIIITDANKIHVLQVKKRTKLEALKICLDNQLSL